MLRFVAVWKSIRLLKKIKGYGIVTPDNWPEYKILLIECLRMAVKADTGCKDNILWWNTMAHFRRYMDKFAANLPYEYYVDLFVTLSGLSRQHDPETWKMMDKIMEERLKHL